MLKRATHPVENCSNCAAYFAQLGDRDAEVRNWMARARAAERAQDALEAVRVALDEVGAPTETTRGERMTLAARVVALSRPAVL
jgi:hypothetical protein